MNMAFRVPTPRKSRLLMANPVYTAPRMAVAVILTLAAAATLPSAPPTQAAGIAAPASTTAQPLGPTTSKTLLRQMSQATQSLYNRIHQSLVLIKPSRNPDALLPADMRLKFDRWKLHWIQHHHLKFHNRHFKPGRRSTPTVVIEPLPERPHHRANTHLTPLQQKDLDKLADDRPVEIFLLRHFIFRHGPGKTGLPWPVLHGILTRLREIQQHRDQTLYGLTTSKTGRILVLDVLAPPGATAKVRVILPNGKTVAAHVYATNYFLNITVLQLPPFTPLPPIHMVRQLPRRPELLLAVAANQPAVRWLVPIRGPGFPNRPVKQFPLMAFLRSAPHPAFIFTPSGRLAAVTTWKKALPAAGKKSYLRNFIKYGQVDQVRFGIRYAMVPANSPLRRDVPHLGRQRALKVLGVYPHSPAQRAGIRPGDIIFGIDGIGLAHFGQIEKKIHADPEHVTLRLARHGKIIVVPLNLRPPSKFHPH